MRKLCIFYKFAECHQHSLVEWIVCKACQKKIFKGQLVPLLQKAITEARP